MKAIFVGGRLNNQIIEVEELVNLPEFSGNYTRTSAQINAQLAEQKQRAEQKGFKFFSYGCFPREELRGQPIINGYLDPMWDAGMLRYETQEVYDILSC
jgi:hypothetical protein